MKHSVQKLLGLSILGFMCLACEAQFGLTERPTNTTCIAPDRPTSTAPLGLERVDTGGQGFIPGIMYMDQDSQSRWFAITRDGEVYLLTPSGELLVNQGVVLDLTDRVTTSRNGSPAEYGGLSIVVDPGFDTNGLIYVYYTNERIVLDDMGQEVERLYESRVSRFHSADGSNFDPDSEEILIAQPLSSGIHVGSTIGFGPDGYLYIGKGDGGVASVGGGGTAQDPFSLQGKFLRIDVTPVLGYTIPPDNPFADGVDGAPEVWAMGFRNPFRWSFDSLTGDLWAGDVGGANFEELSIVVSGGNYGWPIREGAHCWETTTCDTTGLIDPVYEYAHQEGQNSVVAGVVYRGSSLTGFEGSFFFADIYRDIMTLTQDAGGTYVAQPGIETTGMRAIVEGADNTVYVTRGNRIERIVLAGEPTTSNFPLSLTQTGCFDTSDAKITAESLIPYDVNSQLWSDGAVKQRFFAIPDGSTIDIDADADWEFPIGTVLVKTFLLNGLYIETRLYIRHDDGEWAGYSYEWNDEQTDAFLLEGAKDRDFGGQIWHYPSRSECSQCHTSAAGRSLGLETAQQNGDMLYPGSGITANQIDTLAHIGMFSSDPGPSSGLPRLYGLQDDVGVDLRARSYLHANCAMCHQPDGGGQGPADFRYQRTDQELGVIDVAPVGSDLGVPGAFLIAPGFPSQSIVSLRMNSTGPERMPPLASSIVDADGTQVIDDWIISLGSNDADEDGVEDDIDNCVLIPNGPLSPDAGGLSQRDSDSDGYGNACDADLNNDNIVNVIDLGLLRSVFFTNDADADFNGDGAVNVVDLGLLRSMFFQPPGPSGVAP